MSVNAYFFQMSSPDLLDFILVTSASNIKVYADPLMPWTLDGEKEDGRDCIEVRNLHQAIRLIHKG